MPAAQTPLECGLRYYLEDHHRSKSIVLLAKTKRSFILVRSDVVLLSPRVDPKRTGK